MNNCNNYQFKSTFSKLNSIQYNIFVRIDMIQHKYIDNSNMELWKYGIVNKIIMISIFLHI